MKGLEKRFECFGFFQNWGILSYTYAKGECMLNLNTVMIGSSDPKKLAAFYEKVLDKKPAMEEKNWYGFKAGDSFLAIGHHSKVTGTSTNPERIILNFETKDVEKEFDRISKVNGAKVIAKPYSMDEDKKFWIATFADPDGNYFQLASPWQ